MAMNAGPWRRHCSTCFSSCASSTLIQVSPGKNATADRDCGPVGQNEALHEALEPGQHDQRVVGLRLARHGVTLKLRRGEIPGTARYARPPAAGRSQIPAAGGAWATAGRAVRLPAHRDPAVRGQAVFERGVGAVTDIVEKELFRVRSPGSDDDRWALRPEPTAGICRAYVEHGMHTLAPAGEGDDVRADVSVRPTAGGPVPPVLAVRRRGDRRSGAGHRRGDRGARSALRARGWRPRRRGAPQFNR